VHWSDQRSTTTLLLTPRLKDWTAERLSRIEDRCSSRWIARVMAAQGWRGPGRAVWRK